MNKMQTEPMTASDAKRRSGSASKEPKRNITRTILMLIVPALLVVGGVYYWLTSGGSVSTDDAQIRQDIVSVSPQVNGQVVQVFVRNGSRVKAGDILFRIDPQPYRVALEQAQAALANAQLQTSVLRTTAAGTSGDISGAEANLAIKRNALGRQQALLRQGFTTRASYEDALNEVRAAETQLRRRARARGQCQCRGCGAGPAAAGRAGASGGRQGEARPVSAPMFERPMDGVIENADKLQVGQMAVLGLGMVSLVHSTAPWVEANFKEKDVGRMVPGAARDDEGRRLFRTEIPRACAEHRHGNGQRVLDPSGAERQRQLGQGDPARAGADRVRRNAVASR